MDPKAYPTGQVGPLGSFPANRLALFLALLGAGSLLFSACTGPAGSPPPQEAILILEVVGSGKVTAGSQECQGGNTCTWTFPKGTSLSLDPLPAEGFFFAGWQRACSGFAECRLTLEENLSARATFSLIAGDFQLGQVSSPVVVPAGGQVELALALELSGNLSAPPGAYRVDLAGRLVGTGVDQVRYRFLPERSRSDRLVLELMGPDPAEVWTLFSAPARVSVRLGHLERTLDFHLAVAPCLAGCGR
ncbi:hypothetical protein KQ693_08855 [Thermus sp. PS18]|uniref:hypothetical protein n=1 Tax=Thermus sp. PS18 TaxID=2849039 RepID=UPI0022645A72|nr:hypothetical protein [Thermus sp. PS18]UZX14733.1 hypothetical protein KQ693_08855 [Thermus sp. PS18]